MSKFLGQTPFRELLAPSIGNDADVRAIADALGLALDESARSVPNALLYARLANDSGFVEPVPMATPLVRLADLSGGLRELPERLLDLLAWQLHVDGYDDVVNIQAKREMIQASLLLHRRKGTPWAVRTAVEKALQTDAVIKQWFEYNGKPYFFRVAADVTGKPVTESAMRATFHLINEYKNVRSWLDCLETRSSQNVPAFFGCTVKGISRVSILMRFFASDIKPAPVYVAGVGKWRSRAWISPVAPAPDDTIAPAPVCMAGGNCGHSRAWISPVAPAPAPPKTHNFMALGQKTITRSMICPI